MFLQLVVGGHSLLFVTRTERWFLRPPYPAVPLVVAILLTQVVDLGLAPTVPRLAIIEGVTMPRRVGAPPTA